MGGGANGAPTTACFADDIAGVHLQAYWNNSPANLGTGNSNDGIVDNPDDANPVALVDSDNADVTDISVNWESSDNWGAGTGDLSANRTANAERSSCIGDPGTRHDILHHVQQCPGRKPRSSWPTS